MKLSDMLAKVESYEEYGDRLLCNTNGIINATKRALQNKDTYTKVKKIDGSNRYIWNDEFIEMVISTLATGEYASFGSSEQTIMDEYIQYISNGQNASTQEYIIALDIKLGEMT